MGAERIKRPFGLVWMHVVIVSFASFVLSVVIPRFALYRLKLGDDAHLSSQYAFVFKATGYLGHHLLEYILVLGVFSIDYALCKYLLSRKGGLVWSGIVVLATVALVVAATVIAKSG